MLVLFKMTWLMKKVKRLFAWKILLRVTGKKLNVFKNAWWIYFRWFKGPIRQPETLEKLISELLLFLRFFLNLPRPYIPVEWANLFFGRMFGQQLCGGEKLGSRYGFLSLFSIGEKLRGENREHGTLWFFSFFTHG